PTSIGVGRSWSPSAAKSPSSVLVPPMSPARNMRHSSPQVPLSVNVRSTRRAADSDRLWAYPVFDAVLLRRTVRGARDPQPVPEHHRKSSALSREVGAGAGVGG